MSVWLLVGQSALFVLGVYIEKYVRRQFWEREAGKRIKQTSRIVICSLMTAILLAYSYNQECSSSQTPFAECFYFSFDLMQCLHVLIANSLLFSTHIITKFASKSIDFSNYNFKSVIAAPFLEELLFRGSFYRSGHGLPSFVMALVFSLSHMHRAVRKWMKGKNPRWVRSLVQVGFTLVFGLYSFWFLAEFKSVVPSILLHCYCNFLGPPSINRQNLQWHCLSIVSAVAYCTLVI